MLVQPVTNSALKLCLAVSLGLEIGSGSEAQQSAGPAPRALEWERKFPDPTAPKPVLQIAPLEPCINEVVTIAGKGAIPNAHIFFVLTLADDSRSEQSFATIGEDDTDSQGDFEFKFKLYPIMKHLIPGRVLKIERDSVYFLRVQIGGNRTVDTIYFHTCK